MAVITGRSPSGGGVSLTTDGEVIATVDTFADPGPEAPWIIPGLVDLQVNGYGGHDANGDDVSPEAIHAMADSLALDGTTTFVPTVVTGEQASMLKSLHAIAEARRQAPILAASIPYVHVEGPHLSDVEGPRGAHDPAQIRPPSVEEFNDWQEASGGLVGMVTLSPHWPDTGAYIKSLTDLGIRVSLGHSHATPEQFHAAAVAGASFSTHLGNGISQTLPRHPNSIWAQLADDRLTAGFIADGHHLPDDTLVAMLRAKGIDRSFVVSDSVALAGSVPGRYCTPVGGEVELHADGRLNVAGTPYLAGAALCLRAGLGTLLRCGFTLYEAVRMTAANPGRIAARGGTLTPGQRADVLAVHFVEGVASTKQIWRAGKRLEAGWDIADNDPVTEGQSERNFIDISPKLS